MKKMLILAIIVILINILFLTTKTINAKQIDEPEMISIQATAYCDGEITSTGCKVRQGIVAGKKEWEGKAIAIYKNDGGKVGEFIGLYECLDIGGEPIKKGKVIDIYNPSREWCIEFGRQDVFIQVIEGDG